MKLQFLGTSAAEGFPAVFCNCEFCQRARALGGKNIRTRSQSIINDELLIDLPADTYHHFLQNSIVGHKIKYLFVTHSHEDHFYPDELNMRHGAFAHDMDVPLLKVYLNEGAYQKAYNKLQNMVGIEVNVIRHFETVELNGYKITALPARHFNGDNANFYIIESGGKTLLYAHDTGYFFPDVFDFIKEKAYRFDLVTMDCTNIDIPISDESSHMGLPNIHRCLEKLAELNAITDQTVKIINHFSHNGNPLQDVLEQKVKDDGYLVAFDGMTVEI